MHTVNNYNEFSEEVRNNKSVIFYFSHQNCSVCKVLLPKVDQLINTTFPEIKLIYCNTQSSPEVAAQNRIFTVPSVLIYFEGKQYFQFSRNFSIDQIKEAIERPYKMIFE